MADDAIQQYIGAQLAKIQVILDETETNLVAAGYKAGGGGHIGAYESNLKGDKPITPYSTGPGHENRIAFIRTLGTNFATAAAVGPHGFQATRRNYWILLGLAALIFLLLGVFAIIVIFTALKLTH
jgi:hypothetical protein